MRHKACGLFQCHRPVTVGTAALSKRHGLVKHEDSNPLSEVQSECERRTIHIVAWNPASPAVVLSPTTSPPGFTWRAKLYVPPRVPRSTIPPSGVHKNAW